MMPQTNVAEGQSATDRVMRCSGVYLLAIAIVIAIVAGTDPWRIKVAETSASSAADAPAATTGADGPSAPDPDAAFDPVAHANGDGGGSIVGHAFFDSGSDGAHDVGSSDYGIKDVEVLLFACGNQILGAASTNDEGYYTFDGLGEGQYFVKVAVKPDQMYAISDAWNEKAEGELDSGARSWTSSCFQLGGGEEKTMSFGMTFDLPSSSNP